MTAKATEPTATGDAKAKALVDEFLEEKAREAPADAGARRVANSRAVMTGILSLMCVAVWFAPLPQKAHDVGIDPVVRAASARMTVFLAAAKVQEFRQRNGHLPATLGAARVVEPSLEYERISDSVFTIRTTAEGQQIALDSRHDIHEVLGGAVAILERQGKAK